MDTYANQNGPHNVSCHYQLISYCVVMHVSLCAKLCRAKKSNGTWIYIAP